MQLEKLIEKASMGGAALISLTLLSQPAQAVALISNLNGNDGGFSFGLSSSRIKALAFTLPTGIDYTLDSVVLRLRNYNTSDFALSIRNDVGGANPGTTTLVGFTAPEGQGEAIQNYTFLPTSSFTFTAETKYWLVATGASDGEADWMASSPGITPTGIATFTGNRFSQNGGATYSNSSSVNSFQINATAVPEPLTLLGASAAIGLGTAFKRRSGKAEQK